MEQLRKELDAAAGGDVARRLKIDLTRGPFEDGPPKPEPGECWACRNTGLVLLTAEPAEPGHVRPTAPCPICRRGMLRYIDGLPGGELGERELWTLGANTAVRLGAASWLAELPGGRPFLLLSGGVGRGKTHTAVGCSRALARASRRVYFRTVPEYLDGLRSTFDSRDDATADRLGVLLDAAVKADVLVLDDFGAEHETDWTRATLGRLIDARYSASSPTIVTTNADVRSVDRESRTWSRLLDIHRTKIVIADGPDRRATL